MIQDSSGRDAVVIKKLRKDTRLTYSFNNHAGKLLYINVYPDKKALRVNVKIKLDLYMSILAFPFNPKLWRPH